MTRIRARIVCEDSLCEVAKKLNLGKYLRLGKGEETSGGRNKSSILADAVEALIGCIYLESGMEAARDFILRVLSDALENAVQEGTGFDYKTELQKTSASRFSALPIYQQVECTGPAHDRTFYMRVLIQGKELGRGVGHSKKEAEQKAALEAIQKLAQLDTTH